MKNTRKAMLLVSVVAVLAVVAGFASAEEETPWFDLHNCAMCKSLSSEEGLLESMQWETHMIENGALSITIIPEAKVEAFERAHKKMEETGMKLQSGEKMHLCGFCQSYGTLMMSGAKIENVAGQAARVSLMTSSDPAVVEKIQAHAKKTIEEYKKWMEAEGQAHGG